MAVTTSDMTMHILDPYKMFDLDLSGDVREAERVRAALAEGPMWPAYCGANVHAEALVDIMPDAAGYVPTDTNDQMFAEPTCTACILARFAAGATAEWEDK